MDFIRSSHIGERGLINNKMAKMNPMMMGVFVLAIIAVALIGYGVFSYSQTAVGPGDVIGLADCADSTGILTVAAVNELSKGTAIGVTTTAGYDGGQVSAAVTSGTTTFPVGSNVKVLLSATDAIDKSFSFMMPCGGKTLNAGMYNSTSDNPAIRIKNDEGDFMSDLIGGGTTNQSGLSAGETVSFDVEFQGTSLESSGKGVFVVELPAGSSVNVSSIELDGQTGKAAPRVYASTTAGSKVVAFDISPIVGSTKVTKTLSVSLLASKDLAGGVYTTWYAAQEFVDTDGTIKEGIENADGTAKYENTVDFDFYID